MKRRLLKDCLDLPVRGRDLAFEAANGNAAYVMTAGVLRPAAHAGDDQRERRAALRRRVAGEVREIRARRLWGVWPDLPVLVYPAMAVVGALGVAGAAAAWVMRLLLPA